MKYRSLAALGACTVAAVAFLARRAQSHELTTTTVQFDREIVHILDNHCVSCHSPNNLAFPLITYEQTYLVRRKMRMDALNKHMPPWGAVAGDGDFINTNRLTQREIDFIVAWGEGFGPRNNGEVGGAGTVHKVIQAHTDFDTWTLGKPDQLVLVPPNTIPAQTPESVVRTVIDPGITSERWLSGIEFKPGDRRVVRAVFFTVQESGQWLGGWTPWYEHNSLSQGLAFKIAPGSHIVAEFHYSNGGKEPITDKGSLGLYFSQSPSTAEISDIVLKTQDTSSSGGVRKLVATHRLADDTNVLALRPSLPDGIQSIEVSALQPDGTTRILLFDNDIPTEWPTPFIYRRPLTLPKGAQLTVTEYVKGGANAQKVQPSVLLSTYLGRPLEPEIAPAKQEPVDESKNAPAQHYPMIGVVEEVDQPGHGIVVQHQAIPGLMGSMTMRYEVNRKVDLSKLKTGDHIRADLIVKGDDMHVEDLTVTSGPQ